VLEPWHNGQAYLFAFRQNGNTVAARVKPQGLRAGSDYVVTDVRSHKVIARTAGRTLMRGISIRVPHTWSARVLAVTPVGR
jgi:hypothetical protein